MPRVRPRERRSGVLLLHECKADPEFVKSVIDSLKRQYNWPHDNKIPLNTAAGNHELTGHCPYCDTLLDDMETAKGNEAALLKQAPRRWTQ